ncbi:hypothetical protein [Kribbella sp. CA-293567]|uniref:hypothetical protein n=1 Tax=Kribbella sp. CA-293567 TaxID=3002436 RepID=UPI0022DDA4C1|nr:hypothetical protein [Kribbella sp. CA-293567]WBQ03034.1 hypothetical protein OX958_23990 [Kribbella sp. CA-293567]
MSEGAVVSIVLGVLSLVGVVVVAKLNKSRPKAEVTQQQITELKTEITDLKTQAESARRHRLITDDYIFQLRRTIEAADLEVPPWPPQLTSP